MDVSRDKSRRGGFGASVFELDEGDQEGDSFRLGCRRGSGSFCVDEVVVPVAGHDALIDLLGALLDEGHGIEEGTLMAVWGAWAALATLMAYVPTPSARI